MIPLTPAEAAAALGLESFPCPVLGVSIDSRSVRVGDLFVALLGERFDGHDYVSQALAAGASAAIVQASIWRKKEPVLSARERSLVFVVRDSLEALGRLARAVRRKSTAPVVAVTGSVGKTGTKDLIAAMAATMGPVTATMGNQNNEIGVPLTLLALERGTSLAVVEMGMRGRGQIAALARIAEPDVGLVTNVHPVHLEVVGSVEDVAEAKAELFFGLRADGVAVLPVDSALLETHAAAAACPLVHFGLGPRLDRAEVRGEMTKDGEQRRLRLCWPEGEVEVDVPFASRHRLENAVAAAAACYAAGLPLERCAAGLSTAVFTASRGDTIELLNMTIINDTYNASPAAVRAAIDDLMELAAGRGRRSVAVLGDMLELGPEAGRYHAEIGAYAAEAGVSSLWGIGSLSKHTVEGFDSSSRAKAKVDHSECLAERDEPRGRHVEDLGRGTEEILGSLRPGDVVLMKASRVVRLEALVEAATARFGGAGVDGLGTQMAGD